MITKVIHKLVNTIHKSRQFYGKSPLCPCCETQDETLQHILSCTSSGSAEARKNALLTLQTDLTALDTPPPVLEAILHGTNMWIINQGDEHRPVHATTVGSLKGPDILLTAAFTEQFHNIGWCHMLMGRLSKKWGAAVALYHKMPSDSQISTTWTTQAIQMIWKYTRSLWNHRNTVVHGSTDHEVTNKIRASIEGQVTSFYHKFNDSSHFILQRHHYLFTSRTLQQRLHLDIDSINCWLRSVQEAIQALHHHETQQRLNSARFFAPFYAAGRTPNMLHPQASDSSEDEDYSIPSTTTDTSTTTFTSYTTDVDSVVDSHSVASTTTLHSSSTSFSENTSSITAPPSIISWSIR